MEKVVFAFSSPRVVEMSFPSNPGPSTLPTIARPFTTPGVAKSDTL